MAASSNLRNQICVTTAINDFSIQESINIQPNPAIDQVSLIVNLPTALDNLNVSLINVNGQVIKSWNYQNLLEGKNDFTILLPNPFPKVFTFYLCATNNLINKKLIVER